jgi:hypothetical protein
MNGLGLALTAMIIWGVAAHIRSKNAALAKTIDLRAVTTLKLSSVYVALAWICILFFGALAVVAGLTGTALYERSRFGSPGR